MDHGLAEGQPVDGHVEEAPQYETEGKREGGPNPSDLIWKWFEQVSSLSGLRGVLGGCVLGVLLPVDRLDERREKGPKDEAAELYLMPHELLTSP